MSVPNIGPGLIPDWNNSAVDSAGTDNSVGGPQAPANATGPQNPASVDTGSADPALVAPKKAEASLDASAMKATVNAIPINQTAPQKHDYAGEAKAQWEASTSPKQKWEAANNPLPPLKPFVGDHEKAVEEAAGVFDKLPLVGGMAELGHHIAEFATGEDASGNKIDRSEKSRQISREILKEGVAHVTGEAVGEVYGEAIGAIGGKTAGIIGKEVAGEVAGTAAGHVTGEAARKIAGDPPDS